MTEGQSPIRCWLLAQRAQEIATWMDELVVSRIGNAQR